MTNKTVETAENPRSYIDGLCDPEQQKDCKKLFKFYEKLTGKSGKMWGKSLIGFGKYQYKYSSGRQGEFMRAGFAARKKQMAVYVMPGYNFDEMKNLLSKLGKHKEGKCCLTFRRVEDIDIEVLKKIIAFGWDEMQKKYPDTQETSQENPVSKAPKTSKPKSSTLIKSRRKEVDESVCRRSKRLKRNT